MKTLTFQESQEVLSPKQHWFSNSQQEKEKKEATWNKLHSPNSGPPTWLGGLVYKRHAQFGGLANMNSDGNLAINLPRPNYPYSTELIFFN